jgi:hypothetical protein
MIRGCLRGRVRPLSYALMPVDRAIRVSGAGRQAVSDTHPGCRTNRGERRKHGRRQSTPVRADGSSSMRAATNREGVK